MSGARSLTGVGVGLRARHYRDFLQQRPRVDWLEVHTENYLQPGGLDRHVLFELRQDYPISLHGVGLGLGSAQGYSLDHLQSIARLVRELQPALVSEHLCWAAVPERNLNDLLPLPLSAQALALICERVSQAQDCLQRPILLENVSTYLRYRIDAMSEIEFMSEVARRTGCGILLDVNNLYVNQCNQEESAQLAIDQVMAQAVGEIHLAGHLLTPGAVVDHHGDVVAQPVWDLYRLALQRFGSVPTLIEWDTDIPELEVLLAEADKARALMQEVSASAAPAGHGFTPQAVPVSDSYAMAEPERDLADIQSGFVAALLAQHAPEVFRGDDEQNRQRFSRYRGNMAAIQEKTLAAAFPVLEQLVGEEFFAALARAFGHACPSESGNLNLFGAHFSRFLAQFPHVADYPYFPDVARLEWAVQGAYYADDGLKLLPSSLLGLAPEVLDQSCFRLQPACTLMASEWAIAELWHAHQPGSELAFPPQLATPSCVLVCRPAWKPQVVALSAARHAMLAALADGQTFGAALDAALQIDDGFDVIAALQQCLALDLLQASAPH
jgi:uncharacterized protein (UPF0276 family)